MSAMEFSVPTVFSHSVIPFCQLLKLRYFPRRLSCSLTYSWAFPSPLFLLVCLLPVCQAWRPPPRPSQLLTSWLSAFFGQNNDNQRALSKSQGITVHFARRLADWSYCFASFARDVSSRALTWRVYPLCLPSLAWPFSWAPCLTDVFTAACLQVEPIVPYLLLMLPLDLQTCRDL